MGFKTIYRTYDLLPDSTPNGQGANPVLIIGEEETKKAKAMLREWKRQNKKRWR